MVPDGPGATKKKKAPHPSYPSSHPSHPSYPLRQSLRAGQVKKKDGGPCCGLMSL